MIKFFRKIRYDLMEKSKTAMYFKYAIGEIVLVVIGILIALSLNNWNEERVISESINSYLTALKKETQNNIEIIDWYVDQIDEDISYTALALTDLNKENANQLADSTIYRLIGNALNPPSFSGNFNRSVFDDLINSGLLKNIKDQEFKQRIFSIGTRLDYSKTDMVNANATWTEYLMPYQIQNSVILSEPDRSIREEKIPKLTFDINRSAYIHNLYFTNQLSAKLLLYQNVVINMENNSKGLSELIDLIDAYIEDRNP